MAENQVNEQSQEQKPSTFDRAKELTDRLELGMKDLFQSDKYKDYLKSMSHFHNYSSRNIALINMQLPGASRVCSFKLWEEKFNRHVKKGEHGIRIFAPVSEKKPETKLMEKIDPETKAPLLDEHGKVIMEEMTAMSNGPKFKLVPVFDQSQTIGDPLPELVENLTGNVEHYEAFLDSLKSVSTLPIVFEPLKDGHDGYCRYGEKIGIREGMSDPQTIAAIVHELAHSRLHDKGMDNAEMPKFIKELQSESTAYVVCQHYNIETAPNSFGYLAEYGGRDMTGFKASLDTIRKESNNLINAIDDKFKVICQERGIDLTAKVPEHANPAAETPSEPQYTTEIRTENIAGVDFTFEDIIPQKPPEKQLADNQHIETIDGVDFVFTTAKPAPQQEVAKDIPAYGDTPANEAAEIMPDPAIGMSEMNLYGYSYDEMLPLTLEKALELFDADNTIYLLYEDNTEGMALDRSEIENFDGIFGIEREDWQKSKAYSDLSAGNSEAAKESALINGNADTYAIYQLKDIEELRYHRFSSLQQLEKDNIAVDRGNYELVYTAPMPPKETLDGLYEKFNVDHPKDFTGRSLSVSDVVVIQRVGDVTSHYVDNFGFAELPAFLGNEKQSEIVTVPILEDKPMAKPVVEKKLSEMLGVNIEDGKSPPPLSNDDTPAPISQSVYKDTLPYAREHGEIDKYNESRNLNTECRDAIHAAINEARYDRDFYHMKDAVKDVVERFGSERVELLMAKVIQGAEWDGRYSHKNKEWAKGFEIPHGMKDVYSNTHPCLLDGFLDRLREKPSVLETLKANTEKSRQQSETKKEPTKSTNREAL